MFHDPKHIEITPKDVEEALKAPSDFGYYGDIEGMFETWSLGPVIEHRDSDLLTQSNAAMLRKHLAEDESLADDWTETECGHWAVGWVIHLSFRAVEDDGETPTRMFRVLTAWNDSLADYPVADDEDFSQRELDAALESIRQNARGVAKTAPESWADDVWSWLWDNDQTELENSDGTGAYVSEEAITKALKALGFAEPEEEECAAV
jgi:hypothetical protein